MKKDTEIVQGFVSLKDVPDDYTGVAVVRWKDKEPLVTPELDFDGQEIGTETEFSSYVVTAKYEKGILNGDKITETATHFSTVLDGVSSERDEKYVIVEPYVNGVIHGDVKKYRDGELIDVIPYKNGKESGRVILVPDEFGEIARIPVKDGDFEGVAETRDKNGRLTKETVWTDNVIIYQKNYDFGFVNDGQRFVRMNEEEQNNPVSIKDKVASARERVRHNLEQDKKISADVKAGMSKTNDSGYKHISRAPATNVNKGGRED